MVESKCMCSIIVMCTCVIIYYIEYYSVVICLVNVYKKCKDTIKNNIVYTWKLVFPFFLNIDFVIFKKIKIKLKFIIN